MNHFDRISPHSIQNLAISQEQGIPNRGYSRKVRFNRATWYSMGTGKCPVLFRTLQLERIISKQMLRKTFVQRTTVFFTSSAQNWRKCLHVPIQSKLEKVDYIFPRSRYRVSDEFRYTFFLCTENDLIAKNKTQIQNFSRMQQV